MAPWHCSAVFATRIAASEARALAIAANTPRSVSRWVIA
jgi:hypothetical protein